MKNHSEIKIKSGLKVPWLLIMILVGLIIFTVIFGTLYSKKQIEKIRISEQNMLSAVVDLKLKQIINWRQERKSDALVIENNSSAAEFVDDYFRNKVQKGEINRWIESFCVTNGYSSATIFDTKNKIRFSYGFKGDSIGQTGYELLAEVFEKHSYILSDLFFSEATKTATLDLLVPLIFWEQKEHPIIGAILFRIDPYKVLYPLIQSWPTPSRSSETILLGREGSEVVFLNELRFRKGTALKLKFSINKEKLPAARAAKGFEGVFEGTDYRGVDVLAITRTIPDSPWFIVGKVDRSEIYEPLYQQMREYKIILSLLILLMAIALGFWWRHQLAVFYREKYHSELERQALTKHFEYLVKYANDIIFLTDKDLMIIELNERAVQTYGYTVGELTEKNLEQLCTPESAVSFNQEIGIIKEKCSAVYESVHKCKD